MSIAHLVLTRGSKMSVYQATPAENADGSAARPTWTLVKSDVPCLFEPITAELASKVFGATADVRERGFTGKLEGIQAGYGLVVTAGRHSGSRFMVEQVLAYDYLAANPHEELAVTRTTATASGLP